MRAHQIENGLVVNTIEVDSLDFMSNLIEATEGGIGWSYIDNKLVDLRPVPEVIIPPAPSKADLLAQLAALSAQIQALE
ncbi:hypothetical protein UFOVP35_20 [uncultured Caudovirales phage]|uniref:Uncharacterized protein n=1 Tax=uncultured Caudovirales phage TaxID=2100421 RepID=A0A6J7WT43_9CAUD|nr:hypothetical protein UFOVP35_20 [uncultured Caudovirales phage]CAB4124465.1 hypothetical protein UFOVP52_27 [uncultured Caudovirales phage]CAB5219862.1 hypothetical protein UFOVP234_52 [uncultured Caudovirales phage]